MTALRKLDPLAQERRRHARVKVAIDGRLMLESRQEFACRTVDMSAGGVRLRTEAQGRLTERVVVYLDHFGRLEGMIVRVMPDGFAIKYSLPAAKRDRVADLLTWLANLTDGDGIEDRRHKRIVPHNPDTTLLVAGGASQTARIVDISISGAGLAVSRRPTIGTRVTIGSTPGRVVRHFENGVAVEFMRLVPSESFDEDIVL